MARKRTKQRAAGRVDIHLSVDADVASRLGAYAGFHRRTQSDCVAEAVRLLTRGFSARQEPVGPKLAADPSAAEGEGERAA